MKLIKKIAVVGEGKMGSSIFLYLNGFDFELTWLCSSESESERAQKTFLKKTRLQFHSGVLKEEEYNSKLENTKITSDIADLKKCDLIIEAITEDPQAKRKLFDLLIGIVCDECIITTNSSACLPSQLISPASRLNNAAGLHFFFPVNLKSSVELITGQRSSPETRESLLRFLEKINKKVFLQDEAHAFILNRLLLDFQAEAFNIISEGNFSIAQIDELVRNHFFPIGVFEFFDHVGIDVMYSSIRSYTHNSSNKEFYNSLFQKLEGLLKLNRLGVKTREGFYDYSNPQDPSAIQSFIRPESKEEVRIVMDRLWGFYLRSVNSVIDSGICSKEDLASHMKDYLGMDSDPFTRG